MKPHRVRMTHSLVLHYGLYSQMDCFRPRRAEAEDLCKFHSEDYVAFLKTVTQDKEAELRSELETYNLLEDCPVFDGLWRYCSIYAGGSIGAAVKLNYGTADIAINWAGGLHHGKKAEASGFCYINDIVLAILELLKYHQRVFYIDIDVHHGDGVEEAFLTTDRVMTLSLHKFGDGFFPSTGDIVNIGHARGKHYSVNVPLKDGITDEAYQSLFRPVVAKIMEVYRPEVIVLQCGADSLAGDRLGVFNLSSNGHAACVEYMKSFGLPMMLLGGGGYKIVNVARCWAKETGVALGINMEESLPVSEYDDYYAPTYRLTVEPKESLQDQNSKEYLEELKIKIFEYLSHVTPAPSVPFYERPPDAMHEDELVSDRVHHQGPVSPRARRGPMQRLWSTGAGGGGSHHGAGATGADRGGDAEDLQGAAFERQLGGSGSSRARMDISYRDNNLNDGGPSSPRDRDRTGVGGVRSPRPAILRPPSLKDQGGESMGI